MLKWWLWNIKSPRKCWCYEGGLKGGLYWNYTGGLCLDYGWFMILHLTKLVVQKNR